MTFIEFQAKYEHKPVTELSNSALEMPLVSVCIQTYKHGAFIQECINSILNQQTGFVFEILLSDDASTDGTKEICVEYAEKHPDKIRLFLHQRENNIAIGGNPTGRFSMMYNMHMAKGRYIATCEGDDYWTDPHKLQKQFEVLESEPEVMLSTTNLKVLNQHGDLSEFFNQAKTFPNELSSVSDFFGDKRINIFAYCTFMFRKEVAEKCMTQEAFPSIPFGDWCLVYTAVSMGRIHFLNKNTAIYRIHDTSLMRSQDSKTHLLNLLDLDNFASQLLPTPYSEKKRNGTFWYHDQLSYTFAEEGNYSKAIGHFFKGLMIKPVRTPFKSYISHLRNLGYYWKKGLTS